ncbi:MAG: Gldg family protein [Candidatus Hydrogenedentota bacterium]
MKNVLTILRRDLGAFFKSPIGYIYMIVFLVISVGLYMATFFAHPVANMRAYFSNLPMLLCVFIPAVTMRVWAEERKENTWEMLLTFPMRATELVLGKFLACLAFFVITLCATVTVPIMLAVLGEPDFGVIVSGYLGTLLLGAYFLAIGIFFSGFCKDQIVAFVVTLLACFLIFLLGTNFAAAYIDGLVSGLGSFLAQVVGVIDHYNAFTRGVVEVAAILYFAAWTALFLFLNVLYLEGRNRPGMRTTFGAAVGLCAGIGLLFNWLIADQSLGRFDWTEENIYTVSEASVEILSELEAPLQVRVYITPRENMPTAYANLERDITDKLEELRVASGGMVEYSTVPLMAGEGIDTTPPDLETGGTADAVGDAAIGDEEEADDETSLRERMYERGVRPFSVQTIDEDQVSTQMIYSSIGIAYRDREEEFIPQVVPQTLPDLEYRIVSTAYKMAQDEMPVIAMAAPEEAVHIDAQTRQVLEQMGQQVPDTEDPFQSLQQMLEYERYEVERVDVTEESPLPDHFDALLVLNPRELNERQRWEINRVLNEGIPVIMAVQNYQFQYEPTQGGVQLHQRDENPQVNELLAHYGIQVDRDILMDTNHFPLSIQAQGLMSQLTGAQQEVDAPLHIRVHSSSMDDEWSITNRLSNVFYIWGSALDIDSDQLSENGLDTRVLMTTSERAWKVASPAQITLEPPETGLDQYPLMAYVSGAFPDVYEGEDPPPWPDSSESADAPTQDQDQGSSSNAGGEANPNPNGRDENTLILIGCSEMFRDQFLGVGNNLDLILNSVDAVTLGEQIVHIRGAHPIDRTIETPSAAQRAFWRFINFVAVNAVIAGAGVVTALMRRRARHAYTMKFQ